MTQLRFPLLLSLVACLLLGIWKVSLDAAVMQKKAAPPKKPVTQRKVVTPTKAAASKKLPQAARLAPGMVSQQAALNKIKTLKEALAARRKEIDARYDYFKVT